MDLEARGMALVVEENAGGAMGLGLREIWLKVLERAATDLEPAVIADRHNEAISGSEVLGEWIWGSEEGSLNPTKTNCD